MKQAWTKFAMLLVLVLLAYGCAETAKERRSDLDSAEDFYHRGVKYVHKGDYDEAVSDFKTAIKMDRKYLKAYAALGRAYEKLNRVKEAEEVYEDAVKIDSDYLPAREGLGLICFRQKKFQEAEKSLILARKYGSQVPEVYYALGEIEQREKECKEAIASYKQALKLDPDFLAAKNGLKAAEDACKHPQKNFKSK